MLSRTDTGEIVSFNGGGKVVLISDFQKKLNNWTNCSHVTTLKQTYQIDWGHYRQRDCGSGALALE